MKYRVYIPNNDRLNDYNYKSAAIVEIERPIESGDIIMVDNGFVEIEVITYNKEFKMYCLYCK